MYRAVLFDFDDTLVRTHQVRWAHHKWVAKHHFQFDLTDEVLATHYGKSIYDVFEAFYGDRATAEELIALYEASDDQFRKVAFEDTAQVIAELACNGVTMGIVTSALRQWVLRDLPWNGVNVEHFAFINGPDESQFHKPDPRVFETALTDLEERGIDRNSVAYVGDALVDYDAAQGAGIDFIAITSGRVKREMFHQIGAKTVVGSLTELLPLVTG